MIGLLASMAGTLLKAGGKAAWKTTTKVFEGGLLASTKRIVGGLSGPGETGAESVLRGFSKAEWGHLGGFAGFGAVAGGIRGAVTPHESMFGEAVKEAAIGAAFYTFLPALAFWQLAAGAAQMAIGLPSALERMDRGVHVNRLQKGYERSRPVNYDPTANASLRKRSLQYIMQSRQNTRSFIGAEAKAVHQEESGY